MGDFAAVSDVVAAQQGVGYRGGVRPFTKASITTVAGFFYSGWTMGGTPAAGATPGAAAQCTQATTGALATFSNAPSGGTNRLLSLAYAAGSSMNDILYDRLTHMGGLSGTVFTPTAQTVNLSIATAAANGRCAADGSDVEWFLEWYTATGATGVTVTISYTNQAGTAGQTTTVTIPASVPAFRLYPINVLAAGDTSIKSIESITLSASTGTAGSFGVTAAKRLCITPYNPGQSVGLTHQAGGGLDHWGLGMPVVPNDACLWLVSFCNSSSFGIRYGYLTIGGVP